MAIKSFSNIIKELREQKNFTQKMVEELTGIDRTTISAYEKGKSEYFTLLTTPC